MYLTDLKTFIEYLNIWLKFIKNIENNNPN